jgi:hypothetical protein
MAPHLGERCDVARLETVCEGFRMSRLEAGVKWDTGGLLKWVVDCGVGLSR